LRYAYEILGNEMNHLQLTLKVSSLLAENDKLRNKVSAMKEEIANLREEIHDLTKAIQEIPSSEVLRNVARHILSSYD
jgi:hypothetical protein